MRAVTFQEPGVVAVEDVPEPEIADAHDAIVAVEASAICGSDLHIYRGRVKVEKGFTIGHELVGKVVATGSAVERVAVGDRVLGCFHTACGTCFFCLRGSYHRCERGKTFGHGSTLGNLQGSQAEMVLVPYADVTLRQAPEGMSPEVAVFAGDVMGTAYHGVSAAEVAPGDTVAVLGLGPVGLCAVQVARAAGASAVFAVDSVPERLAMARTFGAQTLHLSDDDVKGAVRAGTGGRGVDAVIDAVGDPSALAMAISLARRAGVVCALGVYAERCEIHMGLAWLKGLTIRAGIANVIAHLDSVMAMLQGGILDPMPLVSRHMSLDDAAEAYAIYDRREALKIMLMP